MSVSNLIRFALITVLVILLLVLLLNLENFHIWCGADNGFQIFSLLHLVKYELKSVRFDEVIRQHQFFGKSDQLLDWRRWEYRIYRQSE